MGWRGILTGACFGQFFCGPVGVIVGAAIGHAVENMFQKEATEARRRAWREYARRTKRNQERFWREFASGRRGGGASDLSRAYSELGVSEEDSNETVKRAYRSLAKRNHPDLLRAKGASERQVAEATERMSRLNAAWAKVREARGI